jgi:hypothetical protein
VTPAAELADLVGRGLSRGFAPPVGGSADPGNQVPVASALAGLLPGGALDRGSVVTVTGSGSLVLALIAEASSAGAWCAEVGTAGLGIAAAAEAGIALDRFARVPRPGERWPEVVAALLDGFDIVVVHPWVDDGTSTGPPRRGDLAVRAQHAIRRLTARARERGAVVIATSPWEGASLHLSVTAQRWHGLGDGHGHLTAREVEVTAVGRGSAVRPRRARLWLPGPDGRVAPYAPPFVHDQRKREAPGGLEAAVDRGQLTAGPTDGRRPVPRLAG